MFIRGESQGRCSPEVNLRERVTPLLSSNKAEPTLALKPREDVTRSPKQGYQWPREKDSCPPKKTLKKKSFPLTEKVGVSDDNKIGNSGEPK